MEKKGLAFDNIMLAKWASDSSLWLLAIFAGLFTIYSHLVSNANDGSLMGSSLLYWIAIGSMLWSRKDALDLRSGVIGTFVGLLIISLVLLKAAFMSGYDPFLRIMPFLSGIGMCFLASGIFGSKQYWRELVILSFLIPPPSAITRIIDSTLATAKFSAALLWYSGFDVSREGFYILTPNGAVEVYAGCSGIDTMLHLLGLSFLFLMLFRVSRVQKVLLPIVSLIVAFVVNGIRVAIMAVLSAPNTQEAFEYWHKGDGSLLFSLIGVTLLGIYCYVISGPEDNSGMEDVLDLEDFLALEDNYSDTRDLGEIEK